MKLKILIFGEILWDIFISSDGTTEKIGGAPYNLAAHAAKLGADAFLVSAVGDDALGEKALAEAKKAGVHTDFIFLSDKPTGFCAVTLDGGNPHYRLADNTAYDYIDTASVSGDFDALCFGLLALREEHNRKTLFDMIDRFSFDEVLFDANIRNNFCPPNLLDRCLKKATILKASREETAFLGLGDIPHEELCEKLALVYPNLKLVLITLDKDGAFAFDCRTKMFYRSQTPKNTLVSAVGAGDSFSACFLCNIQSGADIQKSLERAVTLSDFVVTKLEAVPDYPKGLLEITSPMN